MSTGAVLLIDDNVVQAGIRQTILRRAGFNVIAALSPERALEQVRKKDAAEPLGLVITDHLMPGMDGATFVRELRGLEPAIPVLVITGLDEAEEEYVGLQVTFKTKPLAPDALIAIVQEMFLPDPG